MTTENIIGDCILNSSESIKSLAYLKYLSLLDVETPSYDNLQNLYNKLDNIERKKRKILKKMKYVSKNINDLNKYFGQSDYIRLNEVYRGYQDKLMQYHNEAINCNKQITELLTNKYYES